MNPPPPQTLLNSFFATLRTYQMIWGECTVRILDCNAEGPLFIGLQNCEGFSKGGHCKFCYSFIRPTHHSSLCQSEKKWDPGFRSFFGCLNLGWNFSVTDILSLGAAARADKGILGVGCPELLSKWLFQLRTSHKGCKRICVSTQDDSM